MPPKLFDIFIWSRFFGYCLFVIGARLFFLPYYLLLDEAVTFGFNVLLTWLFGIAKEWVEYPSKMLSVNETLHVVKVLFMFDLNFFHKRNILMV